ncbi:MAG TPA: FAD-dependent oxidoreductase [Pseudobacteroides sp.]|uniref:FAD-dependent oxidoreductase n=1 Tax=Pseudobacteroides sp. TaxID=1968840 RepID=UPI002F91FD83
MRILIIGAVAAGTSAAAKARRNSEDAEIIIYEKDSFISYSGCGMPYYLGKHIEKAEELTPRDPEFFRSKYNVDIRTRHEVLSIEPSKKELKVRNLETNEVFSDNYDKLVLATGAKSVIPPIPGVEKSNVFTLRNIIDMNKIATYIAENIPQKAVIVGTGFIGLEVCENLSDIGLEVTLVEKLPQVTPGLDSDMAVYVEAHLKSKGVKVLTNSGVIEISDNEVFLSNGEKIPADIIIIATGVRPNVELAKSANLELGHTGAIKVNKMMQTSDSDIYACGDCIEQYQLVTGKPVYRPLGSTANKTGRIAGDCVTGGSLEFRGVLGTGIFKMFDLAVAQTGLSEREAIELGLDVQVCHNIKPNKPEYMGGKEIVIKAVADRNTGRLLGVQIIGEDGVDKRIDVFVTAITFGAKAEDLFHLDLAYAPPFSTTKDPVMYTGMILDNAINKGRPLITAKELDTLITSGEKYNLVDARVSKQYDKDHVDTAVNIPHEKLRNRVEEMDKDLITITYCNKGVTGNAAQNILINKGFNRVYNISGGHKTFSKWRSNGNSSK